jgi:hypothetical protein
VDTSSPAVSIHGQSIAGGTASWSRPVTGFCGVGHGQLVAQTDINSYNSFR